LRNTWSVKAFAAAAPISPSSRSNRAEYLITYFRHHAAAGCVRRAGQYQAAARHTIDYVMDDASIALAFVDARETGPWSKTAFR